MHTPELSIFKALLFDLYGVVGRTALVHATAWKRLFDDFLERRARDQGSNYEPFEIATDYVRYVDGQQRLDGVDGFLRASGIELCWGDPSDAPGANAVCGLGNAKNRHFHERLERHGVEVFDDTVALIQKARARGARSAIVSASENCRAILKRAGLIELSDAAVTGIEAAKLGLAGKPAPDTFLKATELLGVPPRDAVVFEDAIVGVQAGRAGGFGLVVGVDRGGAGAALLAAGAHVVADLREPITSG